MSDFEEALVEAVRTGTARGRLPGAADAVRRGRRRTLRARTGVAALGVAAIGGSLGVASAFGGAAGGSASAPAQALSGHATGDGLLPAQQWPFYGVAHWDPHFVNSGGPGRVGANICLLRNAEKDREEKAAAPIQGNPPAEPTYAVVASSKWGVDYDPEVPTRTGGEYISTFATEAEAATYLEQARCSTPEAAAKYGVPQLKGVNTEHGTSWVKPGTDPHEVTHGYLVRSGNRIAVLQISESGSDVFASTADDQAVLRNLEKALS